MNFKRFIPGNIKTLYKVLRAIWADKGFWRMVKINAEIRYRLPGVKIATQNKLEFEYKRKNLIFDLGRLGVDMPVPEVFGGGVFQVGTILQRSNSFRYRCVFG